MGRTIGYTAPGVRTAALDGVPRLQRKDDDALSTYRATTMRPVRRELPPARATCLRVRLVRQSDEGRRHAHHHCTGRTRTCAPERRAVPMHTGRRYLRR